MRPKEKNMLDTSQIAAPVVTAFATYLTLSFVPELGLGDALSFIDKLGGATLAGGLAFAIIKWLLKDRENQAKKLEEMHRERLEMQEKHHQAIVKLLTDGK